MLDKGMVPTVRVAPMLRRYLEESGEPGAEAHGSLPRILKKWENEQEWAEFNAVDHVFCKISDTPLMLWLQIEDVYYGCNVDASRVLTKYCARRGCAKVIVPQTTGGKPKKFCSRACRDRTYQHNRGVRPMSDALHHCIHGHEKTPENWKRSKGGKYQCLACMRKRSQARRDASRVADRLAA